MSDSFRQQFSDALRPIYADYAAAAANPAAEINAQPAPFLHRYTLYEVIHRLPHRAIVFYAAFAPGEPVFLITGTPDNYVKMAQADGVQIDSPETAAAYAQLYLRVTRPLNRLFYLVDSVNAVKFRPGLEADEIDIQRAFLAEYKAVIQPPQAVSADDGYKVTLYAIRQQQLERHHITVKPDGHLADNIETLERDLPLVYGL